MNPATGSAVTVALLFPDLLGTYGDSGNAVILAQRLRWRGIASEVLTVRAGEPVPQSCELYVVGGGEDLPQALAARQLGSGPGAPLRRAVDRGAAVLAVCAGLQIIGARFTAPDGTEAEGLGLLDCVTRPGRGPRAVGEIVVEPAAGLRLPVLTGYENHAGVTTVGPGAAADRHRATGGRQRRRIRDGRGVGRPGGRDLPARTVLARNPALADRLLGWVVGDLDPLDDSEAAGLRAERLAAGQGRQRRLVRRRP